MEDQGCSLIRRLGCFGLKKNSISVRVWCEEKLVTRMDSDFLSLCGKKSNSETFGSQMAEIAVIWDIRQRIEEHKDSEGWS